ncbi:non-ribosomal peptide synthetase [Paraburkholderia sp. BCC1886]|uniref:non-ribosomal peptide synthetase n=1 Tax=Paraburkholderia sp. BCC1886 TaxID=2562670 RepID=UPI001182F97F|nr:non-ribosomal peptide synthetase [Paraburkholderia sp. BCC1886]
MTQIASEVSNELLSISTAYVALPPDKREAFRGRVKQSGIDAARLPVVPFPGGERRFALSHAQERLWFLWRLDPSSAAYNVTGAVRLRGRLDVTALRSALDRVVDAHESLRQRFDEVDGVPFQTTGPRQYGWDTFELASTNGLDVLLASRSALPFDLEGGPLLRVALIALGPNDHVLHIAVHHIVSDGLSIEVFVSQFAAAYRAAVALAAGAEPRTAGATPAATSALQYGDYAQWQREWFDEDTLARQLDYWRGRLGGDHPVLELPHRRTRNGMRSGAGARIARVLPVTLQAALARLSLAADATPFMTLLAAYDVLLARYSGQSDIRVGVPVAGRDRPEVARTIGFFVNTLVIRTEFAGVARFKHLLAQVRERVLEAQGHADLPFTKLVEALQPQRSFGHTPLFQAMFNYLGADRETLQLPGLDVSNHEVDTQTARFDLVLEARDRAQGLEVALTYAEDLFDGAMIGQMLDHYVSLLEQIAAQPDVPLGALQLNRDIPALPPEKAFQPVPTRFADSVARRPYALAVHCEGERATYKQLDDWAALIARRLAHAGVRADERVGICMTRSIGMVAALLGTLRSPGAFVPLDPAYPADRLAMMMDDAGVRVVLTDASTLAQCGELFEGRVALDVGAADGQTDEPVGIEETKPHPAQLAYVIYTSGSTGRPKGVAISHGAFAAHLDDFIDAHGIGADDTVLQSSTINFDVALHELLPALLRGGKVEMRGAEPWDIDTTSRHLIDARVTFSRLPTAYWQQWLRSPPAAASLSALRQITVGGEGLPGDALAQWRDGPLGHIGLANLYGPTETTVACMFRATTADDTSQPIVSIGTPYGSRTARVLDRDGNDAPVGALGELCIGGHTLARGYLDRPALTAERFVPDPSGTGARLYRTGDLCRRRADGAIDFLGRLDQQIKLRGFRIEPGEIEAALRRQTGVASAVVVLTSDLGAPRLVAYVVGKDAAALDDLALQRVLAQELPAHMVPSAIAVLDKLPVMQNGKVDRAALPAIGAAVDSERIAPRNDAERIVLALWSSVLGRDDLSVDDDFFAVGGDSILSLQLIARARAQGWLVTPRQVFEQPSIARLAAVMVPLDAVEDVAEIRDVLPLTPIQAWFFTRYPEGEAHWNQSVLLDVRGELDTDALERALAAVVRRHDALRLRFERLGDGHGEGWRQQVLAEVPAGLCSSVSLPQNWTDALRAEGQRAQRQLDPESGRLLRAVYFRLPAAADGASHGRLLLVVHHLAVDGVSWRILLGDLQAAYAATREGRAPTLDAALPWSAWVVAQREAITENRLALALPAWQDMLREAAQSSQPVLKPAIGTTATSRVLDWRLDAAATDALRRAAPRAYRLGIDELLLAALTRAVASTFGGSGALLALEGHGRGQDIDSSRTVGWFTTRYPVWLSASQDDASTLIATKERLRNLPDDGASWGWLHACGDDAARSALAALPAPRISFNYLGQFDQSLAVDGPFGFASEDAGNPQPDDEALVYPLDLNGMIVGGCLSLGWRYDPAVLPHARVEALMQAFDREVARLVAHCAAAVPRASAADFPLARLTQSEFEALGVNVADIEDVYPATPLQQGLLFHSLLKPDAYVNRKRLTLHGALDIDAMRSAWRTVVERHAVLRTRFVRAHGGGMLQVVHKRVPEPFSVTDWRTRDDYEQAFTHWFDKRAAARIDLNAAPLMHATLFRRPDGAHDLAWVNHHALSDGWSQAQLLGELTRAYVAASRGETPALDAVVPYRRYLEWLDAQPDSADWWRAQLARVDRPALLADGVAAQTASQAATQSATQPATQPASRAHDNESRFDHRADTLAAPLSRALTQAAQRHGVTLNTLIQAAWAIVLARHANRRQAAFGVTVAGRPAALPGASAMQGLFINSLPLWVDVPADRPLGDWLRALQAHNVALRQAEHTPLSSIQQWAGASFGALFDSLLVFENYPVDPALSDGSLGLTVATSASFERTHYPLTLGVLPGERIALEWSWDTARLDAPGVAALAAAYVEVLERLADSASTTRLATLRVEGRQGIEGTASQPDRRHAYRSVTARFEAAAQLRPDARAVRCGDATLSYRELDAWSARIARRLIDAGVRDDLPVGVCIERSPALIAALLGVMRAGGAYVPLDPAYPRERLRDMIDDARLNTVLTDSSTDAAHSAWLAEAACESVRVDSTDAVADNDAIGGHNLRAGQLAYIIYTSGSTGRPKGVAITHGALSLHLDDFIADNRLNADDCVLQFTTVNFDTSVEQIFATLAVGAAIEMRGPTLWSGAELSRVLVERGVTVADFPTGYWKQWMRQLDAPLPGLVLRRVMVAGEALPGNAIAQWFDGPLAAVPFVNNYGPTETAITASAQPIRRDHAGCVAAPIGGPRASRVYRILDLDGEPAPQHGIGELCIGGEALARGYYGRPSQSAERFVPDPSGAPGARLYRTGDLCRWLPDGSVAYVGRLDEQVKVRGLRIELGEIESVLCAQPEVAEAVAIVRGEQDAKRLFAYVVPSSREVEAGLADRLGDALARVLPAYMVPSAIAVLDVLPTLPNGKLDRKALPVLDADSADYLAPRTPLETTLAQIWESVLGVERVGASDDFFALGGHSLLALQVAARLQRALGREVPLRTLFDQPVLGSLAAALEAAGAQEEGSPRNLPAVRRLGRSEARPTHGQERLWFLWRLAPDNAAYHLSLAVRIDGALDARALRAALDDIVARHQMLHTRFEERDGQPWLVVDPSVRASWREAAFRDAGDAGLATWLRDGAAQAFDLARGPLLRAQLAGLDDGSHVFALAIHHIAADGWSLNILIDELMSAYEARRAGRAADFAALPVQYADYAVWQRDTLDAERLARQLDYWRTRLGDEQPVLELPADRPRPTPRSAAGAQVEAGFEPPLVDALQAFARRHDATLFMTLLAAFHALLHRYGGQRDIRIGIPMSGRERLEVEPLIGFFVNTAVIRTELSGAVQFDALLDQVKQRVLEAQANQDVPFAQIVDAVQPVRAANHTPLFQAMFNLDVQNTRGRSPGERAGSPLRLEPLGGQRTAAQFDLTLGVSIAERVGMSFSYATDIFDRATVERLMADYLALLKQVVVNARSEKARPLHLRDFVLDAPAVAQRGADRDAALEFVPVAARIAAQAALSPDASAVRCDGMALGYAELDARATRLAQRLVLRGVGPETRVGVCTSRSPSMLVAVLATLKAGAAYVPLDPAYPAAHLAGMIEDAGLACTLVDPAGRERLEGLEQQELAQTFVDIDVLQHDGDTALVQLPALVHADQLAYVIYTSGSTGKPKGVGVSHGALGRFLDSMQARLALTPDDVWLAVTTLSFDIAALELYLPLLTGATIELAPRETVIDGRRLAELATRSRATVMQATPMGWRVLLDGGWKGQDQPRRSNQSSSARFVALSGGEALPPDLAAALQHHGAQLWNLYGPTETTIWSSAARLDGAGVPITLGAPLDHTSLLVIDADGNPVPENGIGELCIGGANLARGYLGRAGLTADRFIPDPSGAPGARLYRTGDLCRVRRGGRLDYLGRADQQVKLRGFRIELGETEAALLTLDGVSAAACQIQGEGTSRRLIGFVVGAAEPAGLRALLASRLPAQQVPAQIVRLDALPLTSNGKLNRNALPAVTAGFTDAYSAPSGPTQTLLCDVWADVLGIERVGADDDFFALGGNSLAAVRVAARVGEGLGRKIELALLFTHPRLADLAAQLDETASSGDGGADPFAALQDLMDSL